MSSLSKRINAMFARDRLAAWAFVVLLWLVIAFVFVQIRDMADGTVASVLLSAGGLVLAFNTASITAMIRHHRHEKIRIYTLDIEHLDAIAAARSRKPMPGPDADMTSQ